MPNPKNTPSQAIQIEYDFNGQRKLSSVYTNHVIGRQFYQSKLTQGARPKIIPVLFDQHYVDVDIVYEHCTTEIDKYVQQFGCTWVELVMHHDSNCLYCRVSGDELQVLAFIAHHENYQTFNEIYQYHKWNGLALEWK